ncbi:MAG: choice-of-anchor D domain-containing protein [Spirochaetales bacterium]|nr:choice-of-anchor D domain-containing protein [Spirochaetales bacterium]
MKKSQKYAFILMAVLFSILLIAGCQPYVPPAPEINVRQGYTDLPDGSGIFNFGTVPPDGNGNAATEYLEFTIDNLGDEELVVGKVSLTSGNTQDVDLNNIVLSPVQAHGSTSFYLRFDPLTEGAKSATVSIPNNDVDEGTYTFTVIGNAGNPFVNAQIKVAAESPNANAAFGSSSAICGDYAAVGAYYEDGGAGNPISNTGTVYVYKRTGTNTWGSDARLYATDAQVSDSFGFSVAISGTSIVAGAPYEDGGFGDPLNMSGAAYIYE